MKIKRLEIVGFKSFVDKVSLDFQQGITGVVGPNGCGKSNIVDAIRWVMGEQNARNLRGRMMEDVIFGGSETRKPHGLAQVSIIFDNSAGLSPPAYRDFAEIMVTRCLHRSGESDYLINKTPCRLLDITELFMDTGVGARAYSIIEQGKVGMLVSAKPEERRSLIEEAAGVTKFKSRKKSALRKMEATKQNLVRLGDIITEVRRQIGSLKRQAQRAEKFRDYRGEVKQVELSLSGNRFQKLGHEIDLVAQRELEQSAVLARLDVRLEEGDLQLEEQQLQLSAAEAEHSQAQEKSYQLGSEIQRVESELVLAARQREHLAQQDKDFQAELDSFSLRLLELDKETSGLVHQDEEATSNLDELKTAVATTETLLQDKTSEEQRLNVAFEEYRAELMSLLSQTGRLANRREEIDRRLASETERRQQSQRDSQSIQEQQQELRSNREQLLAKLDQVRAQQEALQERLRELAQQHEHKNEQLRQKESVQAELRQALEKTRSRQESLQELQLNQEGYAEGTRILLADKKAQRKIVADLLRVAEKYEAAVEMALGERLQAVLAADSAAVSSHLQNLTEQQARATLLFPLVGAKTITFPAGVPLATLATAQPGFEQIVDQLLSGIFFVDDVRQHLQSSLANGLLLVDRHGCCLDWRGILSGGATTQNGSGLLGRQRQLDDIAREVTQLEASFAQAQAEYEQHKEELLEIEEVRAAGTSQAHVLELQAVELGKDRQGIQAEEDHLNKRLALIVHDLEQIDEGHEALTLEKRQLAEGLQQGDERQQQLENEAEALQQQLAEIRSGLEESREQLTLKRVSLASLQQQQQAFQATLRRIEQQQKEIEQRKVQVYQRKQSGLASREQLQLNDQKLRVELELLLTRREELQKNSDQTRQRYDQKRMQLDEFRDQLRRVRSEAEELRKTVAQLQLRQHEFQVDAEHVRQNVLERYRVDLLEHQVPEATEDELERQQQKLKRLQQRIEALGEVNLMAIEEYREQEERYDFLSEQRDDLN
ncbi:MAG: chromosome segregation protein SMC, partial [Deltaproteobacteria bacterium]|nr:chromosome segregation protein SMC [Deltaproteobacteria bacterium]